MLLAEESWEDDSFVSSNHASAKPPIKPPNSRLQTSIGPGAQLDARGPPDNGGIDTQRAYYCAAPRGTSSVVWSQSRRTMNAAQSAAGEKTADGPRPAEERARAADSARGLKRGKLVS